MEFLHFGIPTKDAKKWAGEIADLKVHFSDPASDAFGIEWLKFDAGSPMHEKIQTQSHVAFMVDNLEAAIRGKTILCSPFSPAPGFRFAFIEHEGAVIELCESKPAKTCGCSCGCGG